MVDPALPRTAHPAPAGVDQERPHDATPYPVLIITREQIPEWTERATAACQMLDHWHPIDGDDETVAARIVSAEEYDRAQSLRYLGLDPAQR